MKTHVVVVDDHVSIREMLEVIFEREGLYEIVGQAGTGFEALKVCRHLKPRLVILDLTLPELSGIEVLRRLRKDLPETRVLVYSGTENRERIAEALESKPHGFVHKTDSLATFREAMKAVTAGCRYFTPVATELMDESRGRAATHEVSLTERERAVLQMVAEGMRNKEMADRFGISAKTVEHHRASLMQKLGVHDVARLTRYALRTGLVGEH